MTADFWRFLSYVEGGRDKIREWLDGLPDPGARARILTRLNFLKAVEELGFPDTRPIKGGAYRGVFEFRIAWNRCEYRIFFCYGPARRTVVLLAGATHKGRRYDPAAVLETSAARRVIVIKGGGNLCEF